MTIQEAIERLSKEKEQLSDAIECSLSGISERNDWGGLVQAIDTVLAELKESKKEGKWKPVHGERYFFRDTFAEVDFFTYEADNESDIWRVNNLPVFKTEEECEKYWHFMDTVKEKSYEFSKLEWADGTIDKFFIFYNIDCDIWGIDYHNRRKDLGKFYFKTEEGAKYIIDNFKEELLKYWL